jgi:undecaprenyl-diphosphatase
MSDPTTLPDGSGPLGPVDPPEPTDPAQSIRRRAPGTATAMVVAGLIGLIVCLVALGTIGESVRVHHVFGLDTWATPFLHGFASPEMDSLMTALTTMGSSLILLPSFVVLMVVLVWRRRVGAAGFLAVASGGALVLNAAMKVFFQRPRPVLDYAAALSDYSFPSGHTMNAFVFYVAVALIVWSVLGRRAGTGAMIVALILSIGVGISRIYLGFHFLTDVVGGLTAGTVWLLIVGTAFRARPTWWHWGPPQVRAAVATHGSRATKPPPAVLP